MQAARHTASVAHLPAVPDAALADIDNGWWTGMSFDQVVADNPEGFTHWLADPLQGAPEGETMETVQARAGTWLDDLSGAAGAVTAITHPMVVRALIAHAIGLPLRTTLAMDIGPLSLSLLSFNRTWRLKYLGCMH